ncbi:MAG: CvpA family protein, partial [Acutalibacteraceae bacterium]
MQYAIDAVLLAVFALSIVFAARKGFFKSLFDLAAYVIAILAARFISVAAAPTVFDQYFSPSIRQQLTDKLASSGALDYSEKIEAAINSIPDSLSGMLEMIGIDKDAISAQVSSAQLNGDNVISTLMDKVITPVGTAIIQLIIFVVLSIVLRLILQIVVRLLNNIVKKLPALKQMNSVLGGVLGAVKGLLVVVLAALVIGVIASAV